MSDANDAADKVGYGRPPKAHRFKKGQPSPNPNGRPKKRTETTDKIYQRLARQKIPVNINGREQKVTTLEAMILSLRNRALKGDLKALTEFLSQVQSAEEVRRQMLMRQMGPNFQITRVIVDSKTHPDAPSANDRPAGIAEDEVDTGKSLLAKRVT